MGSKQSGQAPPLAPPSGKGRNIIFFKMAARGHSSSSRVKYSVDIAESALNGYLLRYRIAPAQTMTDILQLFDDCRTMFRAIITRSLAEMNGVKFFLSVVGEFVRSSPEDRETTVNYFAKRQCAVLNEGDIDAQLNECMEHIAERVENFEQRGSNWILLCIKHVDLHLSRYNPLNAGAWVKMPKYIIDKRAVVNVQNGDDNKCFMWSILAAIHPPPDSEPNKSRLVHYLPYQFELCFDGISFPVRVSAIGRFEQQNDISVNVYSSDSFVYPLRLTPEKRTRHVNLVLYRGHYAWVRNLDRLLSDKTRHDGKGYFCELCLFNFLTPERLATHVGHCGNSNPSKSCPARVVMPEEEDNKLKFKNVRKMCMQPEVVVADFECILRKVSTCQPSPGSSFTLKQQEHVPCAFGFQKVRSCCKNVQPKMEPYSSYTGEDCVKRFLLKMISLAVRARREVNVHARPMLTPDEKRDFSSQLECWICERPFNQGLRVADHCHVCGKYRGAFPGMDISLLRRKGIFCYDFLDDWNKLDLTQPPNRSDFRNGLTGTDLDERDYEHVLNVWATFQIQSLKEYMELYLKVDVLLLFCVWKDFRDFSLDNFKLDPCHYFTLPGLAWDARLKLTGVELELLTDPDMYAFFENGIRGGVATITKRYAVANNAHVGAPDPQKPPSYIVYLDANNLYGWAMQSPLPLRKFRWMTGNEISTFDVLTIPDDGPFGYVLEVDLEYPRHLHDDHNCLPLAPERLQIRDDMLSPHCRRLLGETRHLESEKLVPNLMDKTHYILHYRNLKFYMQKGLRLKKIHRAVCFEQAPWLVSYIQFNTEKRIQATTVVAKNHYKLFNNAVFGKSMENVRKYVNVELVTTGKRFLKLTKRPEFERATTITPDLVAVRLRRKAVTLNKPISVGLTVLDVSKLLIYAHHYDIVKPTYGGRAQLLFTDTDSLMYYVETADVYRDMESRLDIYDTSDYPADHFLHSDVNKKVVGKMKDETSGSPISEFVGLRAKMYSFLCDGSEHKRAKGVKKDVVKRVLRHADYVDILRGCTYRLDDMKMFRSHQHQLYTVAIRKKSLASFDDKRYLLDDGINSLAYGHYLIQDIAAAAASGELTDDS